MKISKMQVDLIDSMGTDLTVVNAARVSFDKQSVWDLSGGKSSFPQYQPDWDGEKKLSDKDAKLIHYLAKNNHWSPFSHTAIQFRLKAPIFVARQLAKHQIGGSWSEVSRRYVSDEPEFYFPEVWRKRSAYAKQGSMEESAFAGYEPKPFYIDQSVKSSLETYKTMLEDGVCAEQARMILPQNTMTEWFWTGSLYFFARVCKQRLDSHAQRETAEVAKLISDHCAKLFPVTWEALMYPEIKGEVAV